MASSVSRKRKAPLSQTEEEVLAEKVRCYPCLYDKRHKYFKEKEAVKNAWEEVANQLEFIENGDRAKQAFENLRKRYNLKKKNLKKENRSGTSRDAVAKAEKEFEAYKYLGWLDEFLKPRESKKNFPTTEDTYSTSSDDEAQNTPQTQGMEGSVESSQISDLLEGETFDLPTGENSHLLETSNEKTKGEKGTRNPKPQKTGKPDKAQEEFEIIKALGRSINERNKSNTKKDSLDYFACTIVEDLRQLPLIQQLKARNEIQNIVLKYQLAGMESFQSPPMPFNNYVSNRVSGTGSSNSGYAAHPAIDPLQNGMGQYQSLLSQSYLNKSNDLNVPTRGPISPVFQGSYQSSLPINQNYLPVNSTSSSTLVEPHDSPLNSTYNTGNQN